jgi:hypothetical protein
VSDFLDKLAEELLLKVLLWLIERIAQSDLASNVCHAIQERVARKGIWSGVSSAIHAAVMAIWTRVCYAWQAVVKAFKPSPKVTHSSGSATIQLRGVSASASVGRLSASVAASAACAASASVAMKLIKADGTEIAIDPAVGYPPPLEVPGGSS